MIDISGLSDHIRNRKQIMVMYSATDIVSGILDHNSTHEQYFTDLTTENGSSILYHSCGVTRHQLEKTAA